MSNLLNLSDSINFAIQTGRTPTFIYDNVTYSFSPQGLLDFVGANATPDWEDIDNKPSTFPAEAASVETAVANKTEIAALVSPLTDYAGEAEITAAIKSIIDALKA